MGCCKSCLKDTYPWRRGEISPHQQNHQLESEYGKAGSSVVGAVNEGGGVPPDFSEFTFADLKDATNGFSPDNLVSESGAPNLVFKGNLQNRRWVAVKKFTKTAWPDSKQFADEAWQVGKLRHRRLANLIGYCCDGDERLLVAEFMPNGTLSKHLFHWENHTIQWTIRLKVACYIAEVLEYCSDEGRPSYHDLNVHRVLFDGDGDPRLSCFGFMKNSRDRETYNIHAPSEYPESESVIFSFGTILLDVLSGKQISPSHALDMVQRSNISSLMDSHLEGNYSTEEATALVRLASQCLQSVPTERPSIKAVLTLASLQNKLKAPEEILLIPKRSLSPMGAACSRMDLTAIHQILVSAHYRDDEGSNEPSFQDWTDEIRNMLDARKRGDTAFHSKDFKTAIDCYTQFLDVGATVSPTIHARQCLCHLMCNEGDAALHDALEAQFAHPDWPTAFYLQAVSLAKLGLNKDASDMLNEAADLEEKKQNAAGRGS